MRFRLVDQAKKEFPVHRLCSVLDVAVSGYFAWKGRPASRRQKEDLVLLAHIRAQFATSNETYGAPRMHAGLTEEGHAVRRHRVARLMRDNGLKALQKAATRRRRTATMAAPSPPISSIRILPVPAPIRSGAPTSVTSGRLKAGSTWRSCLISTPGALSPSRRRFACLPGNRWATSDRLKKDLALNALQRAIALREPSPGLIQHTDRGSQYCSHDYQRLLKAHGIIPSMSDKGNGHDNAMVETVFKTIKNELVWRTTFQTRAAAELALGRYIDGFDNPRRRHSALGYKSPASFDAEMAITERKPLHQIRASPVRYQPDRWRRCVYRPYSTGTQEICRRCWNTKLAQLLASTVIRHKQTLPQMEIAGYVPRGRVYLEGT
jgi:transposase InsO family protein